jgi:hypothetical protein
MRITVKSVRRLRKMSRDIAHKVIKTVVLDLGSQ